MYSLRRSRHEVYAAVDSERAYQDYIFEPEPGSDEVRSKKPIAEELILLDAYIEMAKRAMVKGPTNNETVLDVVRKIAGIAVGCMENHGAPPRMAPREADA